MKVLASILAFGLMAAPALAATETFTDVPVVDRTVQRKWPQTLTLIPLRDGLREKRVRHRHRRQEVSEVRRGRAMRRSPKR